MREDALIRLEDVSKIYHVGENEVRALDHANVQIWEGEFVGVVGPSGSGKSTMMNIIGCLDTADSGHYYLDGMEISEYTESELARIRNEKIGFIFQGFNLIGNMTAAENIELPLIYQKVPRSERKERVEEALEQVGLPDISGRRPGELSGGQQQRVAIARAMAGHPSLFLADEPTGNLDTKTGQEIMDLFHALHQQGHTLVLITHDNAIARQTQRRIHILDGKVREEQS